VVQFSKNDFGGFLDGFHIVSFTIRMPYVYTSSSELLQLTISWINSAQKYVISIF